MYVKSAKVEIDPKSLSFDLVRKLVDEFLVHNPKEGKKFWDCMTALRGPDQGIGAGAARIDGSTPEHENARTQRKKHTATIIRGRMFPGAAGCSAAQINSDPAAIIQLPAKAVWDHFDKHVFKAAQVLSIKMKIEGEPPSEDTGLEPDLQTLWQHGVPAEDHPTYTVTPISPDVDLQAMVGKRVTIANYFGDTMVMSPLSEFPSFAIKQPSTDFKKYKCWQFLPTESDIHLRAKPIVLASAEKQGVYGETVGVVPQNVWGLPTLKIHPNVQVMSSTALKDIIANIKKSPAANTKAPWIDESRLMVLDEKAGIYTIYCTAGAIEAAKLSKKKKATTAKSVVFSWAGTELAHPTAPECVPDATPKTAAELWTEPDHDDNPDGN